MKLIWENLRELLEYRPDTGLYIWRSGKRKGLYAGCTYSNGYHNILVDGKMVGAHRLAWFYLYGELPKQVDHINGNPSDNRIKNLRPSNQAQNRQNSRRKKTSKSPFKGVVWSEAHKKWRAYIGPRGSVKFLGGFKTAEEAHKAYCEAAAKLYGEFARTA